MEPDKLFRTVASIDYKRNSRTISEHDYYLVENTHVVRYDPMTGQTEQLRPDGIRVPSTRMHEFLNGRPLVDEKDARDTAAFLIARNRERETRKRRGW